MDGLVTPSLHAITAPVTYLAAGSPSPVAYQYPPPEGVPQRSGVYAEEAVAMHDARPLAGRLSLDEQGFAFRPHDTAVTDFYDDATVKTVYYAEMERLLKDVTGATRVLVFDHNVRFAPKAERGEAGARGPVLRVHNDYTATSGPQRLRDLLPDEADALAKRRYAIVNVWRPINAPVQESPLALCDARSIDAGDLVTSELRYRDRTGETYAFRHNPAHRWFYFPDMRPDEALFIKGYDSDPARAQFTAHTAFIDPTSPADARPRESIEARAILFF